jgi:hypothetical protein
VAAAGPAGVLGEPGLGGLLVSLGDALGGQLLAQPGMLVVHLPSFLQLSVLVPAPSVRRGAGQARSP